MRRLRAVLSMAAVLVALAGCAPPPGVTVVLADVQRAVVQVEFNRPDVDAPGDDVDAQPSTEDEED